MTRELCSAIIGFSSYFPAHNYDESDNNLLRNASRRMWNATFVCIEHIKNFKKE